MKTKSIGMVSIALALGALSGCHVKPAEATRVNVEAPALQAFPAQTEFQVDARSGTGHDQVAMFLWKPTTTDQDIREVLKQSWKLNDLFSKISGLNRQESSVDTKIRKHQGDLCPAMSSCSAFDLKTTLQDGVKQAQSTLDELTAALSDAQKTLSGMHLNDAACAHNYRCKTLKKRVANLERNIDAAKKSVDDAKAQADALSAKMASYGIDLDAYQSTEALLRKVNSDFVGVTQKVSSITEFFNNGPNLIEIRRLADGSYRALLWSWDPYDGGGVRTFTNLDACASNQLSNCWVPASGDTFPVERASIGKVTYDAHGGVYDFDVTTLRGVFNFHFGRSNYDSNDGNLYYAGDLTLKDKNGNVLRRGAINFMVEVDN